MVQEKIGLMSLKKIFYVLTMGVCLLAACKKNRPNSIEEELIKNAKADNPTCICDPFINKYRWQGEIVYVKAVSGPTCNSTPWFYNSNGEQFSLPQGVTFDKFSAESTFIEVLWSCKQTQPHP
jgi:hypothetical protein